jgi:hypothetical protein
VQYLTVAPPGPSKWPAKWVHLFVVVLFAVAASSCPMAMSRGFWNSPGHDPLGDILCIAPAHPQGLQNGLRRRNFLMPLSILSSTITVAKYHVLGIINKT